MIIPYPLQDNDLIQAALQAAARRDIPLCHRLQVSAFVPSSSYVSLGASNTLEVNVNIENCKLDGVQVFKRLSGGEAVFLSPNCTVFSSILVAANPPLAADFFAVNLNAITQSLEQMGVKGINRNGISDLAIGNKKILGCAIYRKTSFILFQAVLNVCESPYLIQKYLLHPVREPDYRKARRHEDFITSLRLAGYQFTPQEVAAKLLEQNEMDYLNSSLEKSFPQQSK